MIHNSFIYVLIFLILTSRVNTECQSYPSLRCCPDTVWDDEQNKCVGCPPGSQGPNCAIPCSPPYYGKECQFKCACKGDETCHPSFGCVLPTTTTTTKIETTTKISTTTKIKTTEVLPPVYLDFSMDDQSMACLERLNYHKDQFFHQICGLNKNLRISMTLTQELGNRGIL